MSKDRPNETELLKASIRGNHQAFGAIVARYQSLVCAITFSATGDLEKSEELAQQAFVNVWQNLKQLEDLTKFQAWLCVTTRNVIRNFFRAQQRTAKRTQQSVKNLIEAKSKMADPAEQAATKEQKAVLRDALEKIPDKYREPLVLFYRQEKSVKEVARQLELTDEAARQRISRGRKMLREQVAKILETTLAKTKPGKAFTTGVIATISGLAIKTTGTAATGAALSAAGTKSGITAALSTVTAKLITTAAVVVIGIGAVVAYKQISKPRQLPDSTYAPVVVEEAEKVPVMVEQEVLGPRYEQPAVASVADEIKTNSKVQEPVVKSTEPELVGTEDAEFEFKARGALSGLITDAITGEPVTDARIYISVPTVHNTTTDANGFYSFESIDRYGDCSITVFSKQYIGITDWDRERILLEKDKQMVRHFELERGCQIQLRVVDEAGEPIEKARFVSTLLADKDKRYVGDRSWRDRTDAEGYMLLGGFKPAETPYLITTTHRVEGEMVERRGMKMHMTYWDYAPEPLEVTLTDPNVIEYREIVLQKGLEVRGYAEYLDGVPAGDMRIGAEPDWWHSHNVPENYLVDANGYFTLKYVVPETYSIHAQFPENPEGSSRSLTVKEIELPLQDGELLVVTIPERSPGSLVAIRGKVVFADGIKPRYISITAQAPQLMSAFADLGQDRSDNLREEFVIDRLEPGVYRLSFRGGGIEEKIVYNVQAPSEGFVIELAMKKKMNLKGKVVEGATGKPIIDFKIMVYGKRDWRQVSNAEGKFDLEVTGSENRKVIVSADGYASKVSEPIIPDSNEWAVIELGIGGAIEGTVVDERGTPIEGASISYRYKRSRDESPDGKLITTSDANGLFVVEQIPVEQNLQWYVIEHPEYAKELKLIEVAGDMVTETEIVLSSGGSVEGYVYDEHGRPVPETTVYFMDESHFSYWNENRSRLSAVQTDEQGYYRVDHLPEQLCFGFRGNPDPVKANDATLTSIIPRIGQVRRLDFGGQWQASGRLLQDGEPLADTRMMLSGNTAGHETAFTAYATTDSSGRFIFRGIPSGRRYLYWSIPGLRSWGKWSEIGLFDFDSGVDVELGDLEVVLGQLSIELIHKEPNEPLDQLEISVQRYSEKVFWGRRAGTLMPRSGVSDKYVFSHLTPGMYEVIAHRQSYPTVRKVFAIERLQYEQEIDLLIPSGSSSLSGKVNASDPKGIQVSLMLRSINQEITMGIQPAADGSYEIANLPAGEYIIGRASVALSRQSKIKEVSLKSGENKKLDIEVDSIGRKDDGYLVVVVVTEEGLPLAGAKVWLEKGSESIYPHFDSDKSRSFAGNAGEYILYAQYPGYKNVQQKVRIKHKEALNTQEILKPVAITMSKL